MDLMTHAYSLGTGTGNFPTATEWLTIGGSMFHLPSRLLEATVSRSAPCRPVCIQSAA